MNETDMLLSWSSGSAREGDRSPGSVEKWGYGRCGRVQPEEREERLKLRSILLLINSINRTIIRSYPQ